MEDHIHPPPSSFLTKYVFCTDHKVIARQFLWTGLFGMALGGFMAMLIRWNLAFPGQPFPVIGELLYPRSGGVIPPDNYAMLFTMHGTIMIFWAITPILIGAFGNLLIPLQIGARDMAFPFLNLLSYWTFFLSTVILLISFFVPGGAAAGGWTAYPPLAGLLGQPGWGQTLWLLAIFTIGMSTIMGAINYITTVVTMRAPGMGYFDMPLAVWGLWLTAILNAIFVPVLGSAGLLLVMDRVFDTHFFVAGALSTKSGGDPILWQHLFWIFGHPEVYILILPAWGIISDLLAFFSRKPAFGYRVTAIAMLAVTILSAVVYGHHMFTTGMTPMLSESFMTLTMIISIPAEILFLNWLHTLWKGSLRLTAPMLYSIGVVFVFGLGGLTGLYLAAINLDIYLHDTYFVVGHFHLTMAAAVFLGSFAAISFWFPKLFGRMMNEAMGKVHFWVSVLSITAIFCAMLAGGYAGMHRRIYDHSYYTMLQHMGPLNMFITMAAFTLGAAQLIFVVNFFWSLVAGKKASDNPWEVGTLEWTVSSPPPYYNFEKIPQVVNGPHEFNNPRVTHKDWVAQDEVLSPEVLKPA